MSPPARILIVEDEQILAENLKAFLERHPCDVRIVCDAEAAMEMLKTFTPDLVLLDYALPGIDGLRAFNNIVHASPWQPACIMISGFLTDLLVDSARRQGIRHLLCKPFSFAELQREIDLSTEEQMGAYAPAGNRACAERRTRQIHCSTNRRHSLPPSRRHAPFVTSII